MAPLRIGGQAPLKKGGQAPLKKGGQAPIHFTFDFYSYL